MARKVKERIGTLAERPPFGERIGAQYLRTDVEGGGFAEVDEWNGAKWLLVGSIPTDSVGLDIGLFASSAALVTTNGMPRLSLPDAATTSVFANFGLTKTWESMTLGFDFVNDHTAGGAVRLRTVLREYPIGGTIATAEVVHTLDQTLAAPGAGVIGTFVAATDIGPLTPGGFGSLYSLEMTRLGADPADTLAGPIGFAGAIFIRNDPV